MEKCNQADFDYDIHNQTPTLTSKQLTGLRQNSVKFSSTEEDEADVNEKSTMSPVRINSLAGLSV